MVACEPLHLAHDASTKRQRDHLATEFERPSGAHDHGLRSLPNAVPMQGSIRVTMKRLCPCSCAEQDKDTARTCKGPAVPGTPCFRTASTSRLFAADKGPLTRGLSIPKRCCATALRTHAQPPTAYTSRPPAGQSAQPPAGGSAEKAAPPLARAYLPNRGYP